MKKYSMAVVLIAGLAFSYGIRPGFDIGIGWQHLSWKWDTEYYDGDYDLSALGFHAGTTVPYSRYVGLYAEIFGVRFWSVGYDGYEQDMTEFNVGGRSDLYGQFGIGGQLGLIEMIPGRSVSPYFRQHFILYNYSYSENGYSYSFTNLGLGIGVGAEFLSDSHVSPFLEGNFTHSSLELGEDINMTGFSFRGGVRLSWKK